MKSLFFVLPALLLGLTACGAPVAAVTLPDTVQVEKTQTAETAVLYEDADGREVSPRRAALTEWRWPICRHCAGHTIRNSRRPARAARCPKLRCAT